VETLCPGRAAHDALYDAVACAVLLEHLLHLPAWTQCSLDTLVHMKPVTYYKKRSKKRS
jgi:DNA polymerase III epsilon subunit-like protein